MSTKKMTRTFGSVTAAVIVWGFVLASTMISAHDIHALFIRLGVAGAMAWLAPVFIDGIMWLGKLMRARNRKPKTKQLGFRYLALGGVMSLTANLIAGENIGWKVLGALAVLGFILGEIALDKLGDEGWDHDETPATPAIVAAPVVVPAQRKPRRELTAEEKAAALEKRRATIAQREYEKLTRGQKSAVTKGLRVNAGE